MLLFGQLGMDGGYKSLKIPSEISSHQIAGGSNQVDFKISDKMERFPIVLAVLVLSGFGAILSAPTEDVTSTTTLSPLHNETGNSTLSPLLSSTNCTNSTHNGNHTVENSTLAVPQNSSSIHLISSNSTAENGTLASVDSPVLSSNGTSLINSNLTGNGTTSDRKPKLLELLLLKDLLLFGGLNPYALGLYGCNPYVQPLCAG